MENNMEINILRKQYPEAVELARDNADNNIDTLIDILLDHCFIYPPEAARVIATHAIMGIL